MRLILVCMLKPVGDTTCRWDPSYCCWPTSSPLLRVDPRQRALVLAALHRLLLTSRPALTASSCLPGPTSCVEHCVVRTCFAAATFYPQLRGHCTSSLSLVLSAGKPAQTSKEQSERAGCRYSFRTTPLARMGCGGHLATYCTSVISTLVSHLACSEQSRQCQQAGYRGPQSGSQGAPRRLQGQTHLMCYCGST